MIWKHGAAAILLAALAARALSGSELRPLAEPNYDLDPVLGLGADVPQMTGQSPEKIVAFRYQEGWQQVPVQIDQRLDADLGRVHGNPNKRFRSIAYADAALERTGSDPDPAFDADDELVFMFRDTGDRAGPSDPPGIVAGSRVELRISAAAGKQARYAYLFLSAGDLKPAAGKDYVGYQFKLLKGEPYGVHDHPEDSLVTTTRYKNHFSDRWVHDGTQISVGKASGVDILDRDEFQFRPGVCNRSTDTFGHGGGGFIANIDGPVRAVRSVLGCNSGTYSQRDYFFYEGRMTVRTYFRVHPIGSSWCFYDFSPEAKGMKYYDNQNLGGITIDGQPDDVRTGPLDWQCVTGPQGSLAMAWLIDTDIPVLKRLSYYFDDANPTDNQCARDAFAYGASGPATGDLPNTDPVLGPKANRLLLDRIVYYDGPEMTLDLAKARITAAWFPLRVENLSGKPKDEK